MKTTFIRLQSIQKQKINKFIHSKQQRSLSVWIIAFDWLLSLTYDCPCDCYLTQVCIAQAKSYLCTGNSYLNQCNFMTDCKTESAFDYISYNCYAPNFEKVGGHIGFGLSVCVCVCVCLGHGDIVLKLHVWIPYGNIADAYFWFSLNYLPLLNCPLTNKGMKFCKCHISKSIIARNLKLVSDDRG